MLELWQLPTHRDAAHRRATGQPVLATAEKIRSVKLPPNSAPAEVDRAAVLHILWVPWLPGGAGTNSEVFNIVTFTCYMYLDTDFPEILPRVGDTHVKRLFVPV